MASSVRPRPCCSSPARLASDARVASALTSTRPRWARVKACSVPIRNGDGFRSREIGRGSPTVFGHIQMLCVQRQISFGVPVGRCPMQLASARLQQRAIDAVTHQGVNEGEAAAILRQELLIDQMRGLVTLIAQKMA